MQNKEAQSLIPYLTVNDATAAVAFYQRAFGAKEVNRQATPDGKKLIHSELRIGAATVMLSDEFPEMTNGKKLSPTALGATPVSFHLTYSDPQPAWNMAVEAGMKVVMPLARQFWGSTYGVVEDPFGHRWSLSDPRQAVSPEELSQGAEKHFPKHKA
jgi:PhnB protein